MNCIQCGGPVSPDEVGLTRKLINRGTTDFLCYPCLAKKFHVSEKELKEMTERFRKAGCHLFLPRTEE